jgi:flagellar biogenesis protein FliO
MNAPSAALNISSSTLILIAFVILTLWIFSRLLRRKKVVYIPR